MVNIGIPGRPGFIALILVVVKKGSYNIGKKYSSFKKKPRIQSDPQNLIFIFWKRYMTGFNFSKTDFIFKK